MPINYEETFLYTIEELSKRFQLPQEEFIKLVTENKLNQYNINGGSYLKEDELENFVNKLLSSLDVSYGYYTIPDHLKNCTSPWAVALVQMYQEKFTCPASISPAQGDFLRTLVSNIAPKNILEIGCYTGVSTIWLAAGLEQIGSSSTVHSVDLFNDVMPRLPNHAGYLRNPLEYAQKCVDAAQISPKVKFYKMNSREMGEKVHEILSEPIDFLFIDGDHTIKGCSNDFTLFSPHVAVGGYIVLHDIYPEYCGWDGPRYVIDNLVKKSPNFDLVEIKTSPRNFGMAIIRKVGKDRNLELRGKLRKTAIWQRIKDKPLGKFIKKGILKVS